LDLKTGAITNIKIQLKIFLKSIENEISLGNELIFIQYMNDYLIFVI
jgi:hypothetical protein